MGPVWGVGTGALSQFGHAGTRVRLCSFATDWCKTRSSVTGTYVTHGHGVCAESGLLDFRASLTFRRARPARPGGRTSCSYRATHEHHLASLPPGSPGGTTSFSYEAA